MCVAGVSARMRLYIEKVQRCLDKTEHEHPTTKFDVLLLLLLLSESVISVCSVLFSSRKRSSGLRLLTYQESLVSDSMFPVLLTFQRSCPLHWTNPSGKASWPLIGSSYARVIKSSALEDVELARVRSGDLEIQDKLGNHSATVSINGEDSRVEYEEGRVMEEVWWPVVDGE